MPGDVGVGARSTAGRRPFRRAGLVVLVATIMAASSACGDDGRALREPGADQTTTTADAFGGTVSTEPGATTASTVPMQLMSPAFADGDVIPPQYTCRGGDISPPLSWTDIPPETVELALVVRDIDAELFLHWVLAGVSPTVGGLAEGTPPPGVEAANDFGRPGWAGPCPPSGTHNYEFVLFALAEPSGVTAGQDASEAALAIESRAMRATAVLSVSAAAG